VTSGELSLAGGIAVRAYLSGVLAVKPTADHGDRGGDSDHCSELRVAGDEWGLHLVLLSILVNVMRTGYDRPGGPSFAATTEEPSSP